jgi:uncharacterized delta-60 repeat protein
MYDCGAEKFLSTRITGFESKLNLLTLIILLSCAVVVCLPVQANAQAGRLDPTFGTGGVLTIATGQEYQTTNNVIAIQSDGKIVIGGSIDTTATLARVNSNGTLDTTFGTNGFAQVAVGLPLVQAVVDGIAIQTDGRILVSVTSTIFQRIELCRVLSTGIEDSSFNGGCTAPITSAGPAPTVVALQGDGKVILASGHAMARYDTNGQPDVTFGSGGTAGLVSSLVTAIALQSDGKILVGTGSAAPGTVGETQAGCIARYTTTGAIDTTFGIAGQVCNPASVAAIAVQPADGKIVVAGTTVIQAIAPPGTTVSGFALARYNLNGTLDTTFGQHGRVATSFKNIGPGASVFGVAIQSNGDIVAAGQVGNVPTTASSFALARYTPTGQLDTTFGTSGTTTLSFKDLAFVAAVALQSNGKIVVSGDSNASTNNFVVARYLAQ